MKKLGYILGYILATVLVIGGLVVPDIKIHSNKNEYTITVNDKQIKRGKGKDADDKYLIFATLENGQEKVFENTDDFIEGKFDSSDLYNKLKEEKTYKIKTYGYRIGFLSMYENIIDVEEVE